MKKCPKCGAELSDNTKFCSYCGTKIEDVALPPVSKDGEPPIAFKSEPVVTNNLAFNTSKSLADKMKGKASEKWGKLSLYSKIVAVALFAFILLCLVAFLFGKTAAGIIAILQIVLTVVAVLMKKQTIKTSKNWLHFVVLALAVILLIPYVDLLSMEHSAAKDAERFSWPEILLAEVIPEPKSNLGEIFRNSEESLVLYVYKTSAADYS